MTSKQLKELEFRRKQADLKRNREKELQALRRSEAEHYVDLLCHFYNLQIEPRIKSEVPYPDLVDVIKSTKTILIQRDKRRVQRFLQKMIRENIIAILKEDLKNAELDAENGPRGRKRLENEREILEWHCNRERSEWLPNDEYKAWCKTSDFSKFIAHYLMVRQTIDNLLQNRFHVQSRSWLEDLQHQINSFRDTILRTFKYTSDRSITSGPLRSRSRYGDFIKPDPDGYYDLTKFTFRWDYDIDDSITVWCGLDIKFLGEAILGGTYQILVGATQILRCTREDCNKITRIPTGQGGQNKKYCSLYCTKKPYR